MRCFLLFVCLMVTPSFLFSQLDSFDIASYARPDLRRETARMTPNFGFGSTLGKKGFLGRDRGFGLNLNGDYDKSLFVNTKATQLFSFTRFGLDVNFSDFKEQNISNIADRYFNLSPEFVINRRQKKYKDAEQFFEIDISGGIDLDILNFDRNNGENISRELLNGGFSIPLYWGKGRIELVNDAWHALTIIEMLGAAGLLKKEVNEQELLDFAHKIGTIKNFRNTDFRLERIAEYEALCAFLIKNDIAKESDYRFFAHLNDAWSYESFVVRNSGKEWKYGVIPTVDIQSLNDGFYNNSRALFNFLLPLSSYFYQSNYFIGIPFSSAFYNYSRSIYSNGFTNENAHLLSGSMLASISYQNFQAQSINWQRNFQFQLGVGPQIRKGLGVIDERILLDETSIIATLNSQYTINYIPNARSYYFLIFNLNYNLRHTITADFEEKQDDLLVGAITGRYERYVSPTISWYILGSLNFTSRHFTDAGYSNVNSIQAGVNYRLY